MLTYVDQSRGKVGLWLTVACPLVMALSLGESREDDWHFTSAQETLHFIRSIQASPILCALILPREVAALWQQPHE